MKIFKTWPTAAQAVEQHISGDTAWRPPGADQSLDLAKGGECERFVRQVIEVACKMPAGSWKYARDDARDTETALKEAGLSINQPIPGCIIALNDQAYVHGHIAIYAGKVSISKGIITLDENGVESIFENTSAAKRGTPAKVGTKVSALADVKREVSGYYIWGR
jgi:hypothetical protein